MIKPLNTELCLCSKIIFRWDQFVIQNKLYQVWAKHKFANLWRAVKRVTLKRILTFLSAIFTKLPNRKHKNFTDSGIVRFQRDAQILRFSNTRIRQASAPLTALITNWNCLTLFIGQVNTLEYIKEDSDKQKRTQVEFKINRKPFIYFTCTF